MQYPGAALNMRYIWDKQRVPDCVNDEFTSLSKLVFEHITAEDRPITNVTEWCKKEQCWIMLKAKSYILNSKIAEVLLTKEEQKKEKSDGRKEQVLISGIQVQAEVVKKGQEYWEKALFWGRERKILTQVEVSFLTSATRMNYGRIPSEKQCQRIVNIEAKLIDEGFTGK